MYKLQIFYTKQELSFGIEMERTRSYAEKLLQEKYHTGPRTWLGPLEPAT
jgi:hypothetical protein